MPSQTGTDDKLLLPLRSLCGASREHGRQASPIPGTSVCNSFGFLNAKVENANDKVEGLLARSDSFWSPVYMFRRNGVIGARHPEPDGPQEAMAEPIENAPSQTWSVQIARPPIGNISVDGKDDPSTAGEGLEDRGATWRQRFELARYSSASRQETIETKSMKSLTCGNDPSVGEAGAGIAEKAATLDATLRPSAARGERLPRGPSANGVKRFEPSCANLGGENSGKIVTE